MRFAIETMGFGTWSDPAAVVELAEAAEHAGWDGLFLWDHFNVDPWASKVTDPWIALAGAATRTSYLLLGTAVTAVSRHAPYPLARMLTAVDRLSAGRVVLGAGLGSAEESSRYGDHRSDADRARHADELLDVLARLFSGAVVDHRSEQFELSGVRLAPVPMQRPRPPIWIGGVSSRARSRAARWDGWVVPAVGPDGVMVRSPDELCAGIDAIRQTRGGGIEGFDVAMTAASSGRADTDAAAAYRDVGVTWWLESISDLRGVQESLERVADGPPRPP